MSFELHWCAKIKDEVEKLAYQLNEEAERTERPIRRLTVKITPELLPQREMANNQSVRRHLDAFTRGRIIGKLEEGRSGTSVAAEFGIAHSIISRLWRQFQTTGTAIQGFSSGRPRGTTPADDRRLHGGGLFARRPVRCVPLTPAHRRRRSLWCREHRNWRDNEWGRVLFTDESRFSLSSDSHRILIWRERGSRNHPSNIIERDRYGGRGVLVWGGIMLGSRTDLHIFDAGLVNGTRYCNEILLPYVRLFRGVMGLQFLFMDYNAPCHRTVAAEQLLESRGLAARTLPPVTIRELGLALKDEWAAMPQQLIDTLILSMGRRCETCLVEKASLVQKEKELSNSLKKLENLQTIRDKDNDAVVTAENHFHAVNAGLGDDGEEASLAAQLIAAGKDKKAAETEAKSLEMSIKHTQVELAKKEAENKKVDKSYSHDQALYQKLESEVKKLKADINKLNYQEGLFEGLLAKEKKLNTELRTYQDGLENIFGSLKRIETELIKENIDMNQLSILKTQFIDKFQRLDTCQNHISELLLGTEDAVQEYLDDMEDAENYRDRYIEMCTRVDLKIRETVVPTETEKRSFKLPKIKLKKFSGKAKDFLAFWSQFQKIHNDKSIAEEDKMQYLLQSVEPKSKAERLVLSFPATAENYPKAIDQLKERFGREDLLVQIYVRELLNLVMKNAVSGRTKTDLSALYDELEGKL
ncbi:structural maintenance of chromosomes protein 2 [Trichonephila clavipes]|nr:structural maintenance of chromosomes protein 2 [Trichonephila clavipes]